MHFTKSISLLAMALVATTLASPIDLLRRDISAAAVNVETAQVDQVEAYIPLSERVFTPEQHAQNAQLSKRASVGWNDFNCKPSAAHPYPVILVHGLIGNGWDNWLYMGPRFVAKGYCVFSLTYGQYNGIPLFAGLDKIENSAAQLASFVDKVLAGTGAKQVDLVGHSQGTLMPRYYLKFLGGASKVHKFAGFGAIAYGTTLLGIVELGKKIGIYDFVTNALDPICLSCTQFLVGSDFLNNLNAGGDTVPGVQYRFIGSKTDEIVTPFTNGFLRDKNPNVQNQVLQNWCALDLSEHILQMADAIVFNGVHAFLTPAASQTINCFDAIQ